MKTGDETKKGGIKTFVKKISIITVMIPGLAFSSLGMTLAPIAHATAVVCTESSPTSTITLISGGSTDMSAGYTTTDPVAAPASLVPALYSDGVFVNADVTTTVIPPWVDPATDGNFIGSGAQWISTNVSNNEATSTDNQWRLFQDSFTLPAGAIVTSANLSYTADNAAEVYLNGNASAISTTGDVYGATPVAGPSNFSNVFNASFTPTSGTNTLDFVVRNWSTDASSNPTGLLYKAVVNYCIPTPPPAPESVKVTIVKYIQGQMATASSSNNGSFPMSATWAANNIGAGTGTYNLDNAGFNSSGTPYMAVTADMTPGANYSTNEITGGALVGATCDTGQPYALVGYTTGNTLAEAASSTTTTTIPAFTDLAGDKTVIVWNKVCADNNPPPTPNVCSVVSDTSNSVQGGGNAVATYNGNPAWTATIPSSTWIWSDEFVQNPVAGETKTFLKSFNLGSSTVASATLQIATDNSYVAYINDVQVAADSSADNFSSVDTVINLAGNLVPGTNTLKFVVTNEPLAGGTSQSNPAGLLYKLTMSGGACPAVPGDGGGNGNDGSLIVTSIDAIDTSATPDGTFADGWKYVFHITAPMSEQNLKMKFANWLRTGGGGTIPAANNMRISSAQADNGGATILITAADTYSTPALHMTGDLNASTTGRQVEVTVEVAVPTSTPAGSYTTSYGVQTTP